MRSVLNLGAFDSMPVLKNILLNSVIFQFNPVFIVNPGKCSHSVSVCLASGELIVYSFPLYVIVSLIPLTQIIKYHHSYLSLKNNRIIPFGQYLKSLITKRQNK